MFEPIILPRAILPKPCLAAVTVTTSSGREVPTPTRVVPIMVSGIPRNSAKKIDFSTKYLAPIIIAAQLTTRIRISFAKPSLGAKSSAPVLSFLILPSFCLALTIYSNLKKYTTNSLKCSFPSYL